MTYKLESVDKYKAKLIFSKQEVETTYELEFTDSQVKRDYSINLVVKTSTMAEPGEGPYIHIQSVYGKNTPDELS